MVPVALSCACSFACCGSGSGRQMQLATELDPAGCGGLAGGSHVLCTSLLLTPALDTLCLFTNCRPTFQDILTTLEGIEISNYATTAAVKGPVGQLAGVPAPTAAALGAANAAAAPVSRPVPRLPPLPGRHKAQQEAQAAADVQQQQEAQAAADMQQQQHVQAGTWQGAVERSPGVGQAQCMDWSEVSYGRNAKY